jgi:predicted PurR-regulated permease PerM
MPPVPARRGARIGRRRREAASFVAALRSAIAFVAAFALAWLLWQLNHVLLLAVAGLLVAVLLSALADGLVRWTLMPRIAALIVIGVIIVLTLAVSVALIGPVLVEQAQLLARSIEQAMTRFEVFAGPQGLNLPGTSGGPSATDYLPSIAGIASGATSVLRGFFEGLVSVVLVAAIGVYMAVEPDRYVGLVVKLAPISKRADVRTMLGEMGDRLGRWMVGQAIAMIIIGTAVYVGLLVLGAPLPLALGVLVGVAAFVPYIGAIVAGAVMVLVASTESLVMTAWVLGLYLAIQLLEDSLVSPIIQGRAVKLAPAVIVVVQLAFGVLFGILGIMLATPIAAAAAIPLAWWTSRQNAVPTGEDQRALPPAS